MAQTTPDGRTLYSASELIGMGYTGYNGWSDPQAGYDFLATGGSGKKPAAPQQKTPEQLMREFSDAQIAAQQQEIDAETKWVDQYLADNPFAFDEALAKQSVTQEYEPYYKELLSDYIQDVNMKRETTQDEKSLLQKLRDLDVGARTRAHAYAVENAEKGFEGRGLFGSGMRARTVGREDIEYKTGLQGQEARFQTDVSGIDRTLQGYDIAQQRQTRDIGRSQEEAITAGLEGRRGEAYKAYELPLYTAYTRRFPSSSRGVDQYMPPEFLRY